MSKQTQRIKWLDEQRGVLIALSIQLQRLRVPRGESAERKERAAGFLERLRDELEILEETRPEGGEGERKWREYERWERHGRRGDDPAVVDRAIEVIRREAWARRKAKAV